MSDKVELDGLPQECNLMAVSNTYGLVAVGGQSGTSSLPTQRVAADTRRTDTQA